MGGDFFIKCDIPCTYRKEDKSLDVCNINGLMCLWGEEALKRLAFGGNQASNTLTAALCQSKNQRF